MADAIGATGCVAKGSSMVKVEPRPKPSLLRGERTAMQDDERFRDRQSEAESAEAVTDIRLALLEGVENLLEILRLDADAVVLHLHADSPGRRPFAGDLHASSSVG